MPKTINCPIAGFENVKITYPDKGEWKVRHKYRYQAGIDKAPEDAPFEQKMLYGILELVDSIDGLDLNLDDPGELPLNIDVFFTWLAEEVFGNYLEARNAPFQSTDKPTPTPKAKKAQNNPAG